MTQDNPIRIGIPTTPFALFAFYGLLSENIPVQDRTTKCVVDEIDRINAQAALDDSFDCCVLSGAAAVHSESRFAPADAGVFALEDDGPLVIAASNLSVDQLKTKRIATPGETTTEDILADTFLPSFMVRHHASGSIPSALRDGAVDAAVISRESFNAYDTTGFSIVDDLGRRFAKYHGGLPVPMLVTCLARGLESDTAAALDAAIGASLDYAREHFAQAFESITKTLPHASPEKTEALLRSALDRGIFTPNDQLAPALEVIQEYIDIDYYAANGRF